MNAHASQILQIALKLKEKERAEIAAILMQSLDEDADPFAEEEWNAEIQKRLNEIDSGKVKMLSRQEIEEVLKE
jgi:putative addiction module component (TIGR02574 family)